VATTPLSHKKVKGGNQSKRKWKVICSKTISTVGLMSAAVFAALLSHFVSKFDQNVDKDMLSHIKNK